MIPNIIYWKLTTLSDKWCALKTKKAAMGDARVPVNHFLKKVIKGMREEARIPKHYCKEKMCYR